MIRGTHLTELYSANCFLLIGLCFVLLYRFIVYRNHLTKLDSANSTPALVELFVLELFRQLFTGGGQLLLDAVHAALLDPGIGHGSAQNVDLGRLHAFDAWKIYGKQTFIGKNEE